MPHVRVQSQLRRAFLLALVSPTTLGCGGIAATRAPGDGGPPSDAPDNVDAVVSADSGFENDASPDVIEPREACGSSPSLPPDNQCTRYVGLPCGYDGGALSSSECQAICPVPDGGPGPVRAQGCGASTPNGETVVACYYCAGTGRRAEGCAAPPAVTDTPGSFLAHCAHLEAESVHAFRRLARELKAHAAPAPLVARARQAAAEEVRHARIMADLALGYGVVASRPLAPGQPVRPLAAVARENAVEGCVRETYGVLVAMWQAGRAGDPEVRRALQRIAGDEARHAQLAWDVAAWAEPRLSPGARREIAGARAEALRHLRAELSLEPSPAIVARTGVPRSHEALRLLDGAVAQGVFPGVSDLRAACERKTMGSGRSTSSAAVA